MLCSICLSKKNIHRSSLSTGYCDAERNTYDAHLLQVQIPMDIIKVCIWPQVKFGCHVMGLRRV